MLRILLVCPLLLIAATSNGQDLRLEWERYYLSQLGPSHDVVGASTTDSIGNIIVIGTTAVPPLDVGVHVIKYDAAGRPQWETTAGAWREAAAIAVTTGPDGEVFVAAKIGSDGTGGELVLMKYDARGREEWAKGFAEDDVWRDQTMHLIAEKDGSLLAAGSARSSSNMEYGFLHKLTSGGTRLWSIRLDESSHLEDAKIGADGAIYVTGWRSADGSYSPFVRRYDADGKQQWTTAPVDNGFSRRVVLSDGGRLFAAGDARGLFLAELNPETGGLLRVVRRSDAAYLSDLRTASDEAVYMTGYDLVPSFCKDECMDDFITVKLDSLGDWMWTSRHEGVCCTNERPTDILIEGNSVYVTGVSRGSALVSYDAMSGEENWVIEHETSGLPALLPTFSGVTVVQSTRRGENGFDFELVNYDASGDERWRAHYDGPRVSSDEAHAFEVDDEGNSYVAGIGGWGSTYDCLTVSYDAEGQLLWAERYGEEGSICSPVSIRIGQRGSVHVAASIFERDHSETADYLLLTYSPQGDLAWDARYDGPSGGGDFPLGLLLDDAGDLIITGQSSGVETYRGFATVKYGADGMEKWVARIDGAAGHASSPTRAVIDGNGNVIVAGEAVLDGFDSDFVTAKFEGQTGELIWMQRYGGSAGASEAPGGLALNSEGAVYVAGSRVDQGEYVTRRMPVLIKYAPNGEQEWTRELVGNLSVSGLAMDRSGDILLGGMIWLEGMVDYVGARYSPAGDLLWMNRYDRGPGMTSEGPYRMEITKDGALVLLGTRHEPAPHWRSGLVLAFNPEGTLITELSIGGEGLHRPVGFGHDIAGHLYVGGTAGSNFSVYKYGPTTDVGIDRNVPFDGFDVLPNYPNPANERTFLPVRTSAASEVRLRVYDLLGREVLPSVSIMLSPGRAELPIEVRTLPNGVYVYRLASGSRQFSGIITVRR